MLEHEPPHSQPVRSAAPQEQHSAPSQEDATAAQVTAEEFAAAVAAIEARQAEQASRTDKTIPIGQAVDELGVNASADEIWQEVQARRAQGKSVGKSVPLAQAAAVKAAALLKKARQTATPLLAKSITDWQAQVTDYKSEAFSIKQMEAELHARKARLQKRRVPIVGIIIAAAVLVSSVFGGHHGGGNSGDKESASTPAAQTVTLAEVKDGEPVSVTEDVLEKIEKGADAAQTLVQAHGDVDDGWTLVKHGGHVYVRGFTKPLSDNALQVGQVKLYNDNDSGDLDGNPDQQVTLRLDTLHVDKTDTGDGWREMDVSHVHPDAFTHETD